MSEQMMPDIPHPENHLLLPTVGPSGPDFQVVARPAGPLRASAPLRLSACLKTGKGRAAAAAFAWSVYFAVKIFFNFIFGHRKSRLFTSGHLWQKLRLMFCAFCAFLRPSILIRVFHG